MAANANITTLSFQPQGARTVSDTVDQAIELIDLAANERPDMIVLPEGFAGGNEQCAGSPSLFCASAEPLDGPTVSRLAQRAKQHRCYVCAGVVLQREEKRMNSLVVLDREGRVAGVYDKVHTTILEMEQGPAVCPGAGPVVVETDFGKVGLVICFDLNFDGLRRQYAALRPDLIVFATMFAGGLMTNIWAYEIGCYLVSSYGADGSVFVNPLGRTLAVGAVPYGRILTRRLNLDFAVLHMDYNQRRIDELRRRCGARIELEIAEPEGRMLLTSRDDELSAQQICRDMELEQIDDFYARAHAARQQALESGPLPVGPPQY